MVLDRAFVHHLRSFEIASCEFYLLPTFGRLSGLEVKTNLKPPSILYVRLATPCYAPVFPPVSYTHLTLPTILLV